MKTLLQKLALTLLFVGATQLGARAGEWTTDYAKALETAKAEKKNVLLDFTGSDWCGYCKLLDKEVFATSKWQQIARQNFILVKVDFPHATALPADVKAQNAKLKAQFAVRGYPTIIILDPEGKELARAGGYQPQSGVDAYVEQLTPGLVKG